MSTVVANPNEATAVETAAHAQIDRSLIHGIAWTGAVKWLSQLLIWASTIVVARLLSPDDYGIVGMAAIFLGLVSMLTEFGLGSAVVTLRNLDGEQTRQINTLAVLLGLTTCGVTVALAHPLSRFFDAPRLAAVLMVLASGFVLAGLRTVPDAMIQKDLRFRLLAMIEGTQSLITAGATVLLAVLGFRYWTLVLGTLLGNAVTTALVLSLRPYGFRWPHRESIGQAFNFGSQVLISRVAWYIYSNADFAVIGRLLGQRALGYYSMAWSIASIPVGKVSALILRVTPAHFSAVQHDRNALRRYFLNLTEGIALITFPACITLALLAKPFIVVVLGDKWLPAVPAFQLLAAYASVRSITPLLPQILLVTGDARFSARNSILAAVLLPLAFVLGSRGGITGVAIAWLVVHPLIILPLYARVFTRLQLSLMQYLASLWPAFSTAVAICVGVVIAQTAGGSPLARLVLQGVSAGLAYLGLIALLHRQRVADLKALFRK
jgi:PST family polysaccharide transporter